MAKRLTKLRDALFAVSHLHRHQPEVIVRLGEPGAETNRFAKLGTDLLWVRALLSEQQT